MGLQELTAHKMTYAKMKSDCLDVLHAAFNPNQYSSRVYEQAVNAMTLARAKPDEKELEQQCWELEGDDCIVDLL